jgi:hypothetical protein
MNADTAARRLRQLAQLALGVSANLGGHDRAYRLDRAAVAVLHPPSTRRPVVLLHEDGLRLQSRRPGEVVVELCGAVSRLLLDRFGVLELRDGEGHHVEAWVDGMDLLVAFSPPNGPMIWPSPMTVREPVTAMVDALAGDWLTVEVAVRPEPAPAWSRARNPA